MFAEIAVDAVLRLKGSGNLEAIQIIKKTGGSLRDSYLDEGFILDKKIGVGQPKRIENARILVANTPMDTDKIKIYGARVKVDSMAKVRRRGGGEGRGGPPADGGTRFFPLALRLLPPPCPLTPPPPSPLPAGG